MAQWSELKLATGADLNKRLKNEEIRSAILRDCASEVTKFKLFLGILNHNVSDARVKKSYVKEDTVFKDIVKTHIESKTDLAATDIRNLLDLGLVVAHKDLKEVIENYVIEHGLDVELGLEYKLTHQPRDLRPIPNKKGESFKSKDDYLDIHRKLIEEDFFGPLRKSFQTILRQEKCGDLEQFWYYGAVTSSSLEVSYDKLLIRLTLKSNRMISEKKLVHGSLVVLKSFGDGWIVFCSVVDRKQEEAKTLCLSVTPIQPFNWNILRCHQDSETKYSIHVFEANVFYEAYRPVIKALAGLSRMQDIPLEQELVFGCQTEIADSLAGLSISALKKPTANNKTVNAGDLFKALTTTEKPEAEQAVKVKAAKDLDQLTDMFSLNKSQMKAIKTALKFRVGLIQGPPGTGKSYCGTILAKLMIANRSTILGGKPLMVVCCTNRALDSFLESVMPFTKKIVRVGSQSQSVMLEQHNLTAIKSRLKPSSKIFEIEAELADVRERLDKAIRDMDKYVVSVLTGQLQKLAALREDLANDSLVKVISNADVVGMTSTGSAKYNNLIKKLAAKVLIIEEAGQMLEANVLTCMNPQLERLIMIGDHQQLKPNTANHDLVVKKFGFNVSLFERLINNKFTYTMLDEQHRMRPEVSAVIKQVFYKSLQDHVSVSRYGNVAGISKNFFFLNHTFAESSTDELRSKMNVFEAKYLALLANYLLYQGYKPQRITILAAYLGQVALIQKQISHPEPEENDQKVFHEKLKEVNVNVVDNFQGEENDIILLSLVRSNSQTGTIGFLSVNSRVCVALSRAKIGLYIVGNMADLCAKSNVWKKIKEILEATDSIGDRMKFQCQYHPDQTKIKMEWPTSKSWCKEMCSSVMACGHICQQPCHVQDRSHIENFRCERNCEKSCSEGHPCLRKCWESCTPCPIRLKAILEHCGHEAEVSCPSNREVTKCMVKTKITLPKCGHEKMGFCYQRGLKMKDNMNFVDCDQKCEAKLKCGHPCGLSCGHEGHHTTKCLWPCSRIRRFCTQEIHLCSRLCYQPCEDQCDVVLEDVELECKHKIDNIACSDKNLAICKEKCGKKQETCDHLCQVQCHHGEPCPPCKELVDSKLLPCGHNLQKMECNNNVCSEKCQRLLGCGHPCPLNCKDECDDSQCQIVIGNAISDSASCGHVVKSSRLCGQKGVKQGSTENCQEVCGKSMRCGHECQQTCCRCLGGRVHLPCSSPCSRRLLCGHPCKLECGQVCLPCSKQKCLFQCPHKKCKSNCEDPCLSCKNPCELSCIHSKCTKKCSSKCSRKFCEERCGKNIECGHQCLGFCGDPCPTTTCSSCSPDVQDERYVLLACGHSFTAKEVDEILSETSRIGTKLCPSCQMPITNLPRFKTMLTKHKEEITAVFDSYFALKTHVAKMKKELIETVEQVQEDNLAALVKLVKSQCSSGDKVKPLSWIEAQNLKAKVALAKAVVQESKSSKLDDASKLTIMSFLSTDSSVIGQDYAQSVCDILEISSFDILSDLKSFHIGAWKISDTTKQPCHEPV